MTEKQKMLNGELYDSRDPEILQLYHKARRLTTSYNALDSENLDRRQQILKELLGLVGEKVWIGGNTVICPGVSIGNNVTIGAGSVVTKGLPDNVLAYGNPCKIQKEL